MIQFVGSTLLYCNDFHEDFGTVWYEALPVSTVCQKDLAVFVPFVSRTLLFGTVGQEDFNVWHRLSQGFQTFITICQEDFFRWVPSVRITIPFGTVCQ